MSARERVTVELTVEQAQAVQGWLASRGSMVQYEDQLGKVERASRKASKASQEGFDLANLSVGNLVKGAAGAVTALFSVHTVAQLLRKEFEAVERARKNALDFQLDAATAQREALIALGTKADISQQEFNERVTGQTNIPIAEQFRVAGSAVGAAGTLGERRALDTAIAAGEFAPHLAGTGQIEQIASGALELQKSFPEYDPRQAVAQVFEMAGPARNKDIGSIAGTTIPAIGQARAFFKGNASFQELSSLFNAVGQRVGDEEGRVTRSALTGFLKQITTEGAQRGLFEIGDSPEQVFDAIQGDSQQAVALRKKLLGPLEASFRAAEAQGETANPKLRSEAQAYIALSELFDSQSQTFKMFRQFHAESGGTPAEIEARQEQAKAAIDALPLQQGSRANAAFRAGNEQMLTDAQKAIRALEPELKQSLVQAGFLETPEAAASFIRNRATDAPDVPTALQRLIDPVREREAYIRSEFETVGRPMGQGPRGFFEPAQDFSRRIEAGRQTDQRNADALDLIADLLEEQRDLLLEQNKLLQQPTEIKPPANVQPARPAAAALNDQ